MGNLALKNPRPNTLTLAIFLRFNTVKFLKMLIIFSQVFLIYTAKGQKKTVLNDTDVDIIPSFYFNN